MRRRRARLYEFAGKCWEATRIGLRWALQIFVYPFHAVAHVLLVHLVPLLLPTVVLVAAAPVVFLAWMNIQESVPEQYAVGWITAEVAALVGLLGVIPMLVSKLRDRVAQAGTATFRGLRKLIAGPWWPQFRLPTSLVETAHLLSKRTKEARIALRGAAELFIALALVALVVTLARAAVLTDDSVAEELAALSERVSAVGERVGGGPRASFVVAAWNLRQAISGDASGTEVDARLDAFRTRTSALVRALEEEDGTTGSESNQLQGLRQGLVTVENRVAEGAPPAEVKAVLTDMLVLVASMSGTAPPPEGEEPVARTLMHTLVDLDAVNKGVLALMTGAQTNGAPGLEGVVFSVTYLDDGKLDDKTGICLEERQVLWLSELKRAIDECSRDAPSPLELDVIGYSSISPATGEDGSTDESTRWNRRIANERGAVVQRFLLLEAGQDFTPDACRKRGQDGWTPYVDASLKTGHNYQVHHTPWLEGESGLPRPANDGDYPGPRRFDTEMLNRSAHIVFRNNVCFQGRRRAGNSGN